MSQPLHHVSERHARELPSGTSPEIVLRAMQELARELATLHRSGRIHRDISSNTVTFEWSSPRASLIADVRKEAISFGGLVPDPERCPPELRRTQACDIPPSIDDARRVLIAHGILMGPERIDLYQFGTLLCRQITGRSLQAYLSSPGVLFRVPAAARRVIDGCIGYDELHCLESANQLLDLLDELLGSTANKPAGIEEAGERQPDTRADALAETRAFVRRPPFERLGHFEIHDEIGHGGMGTVYRAYDRSLDRLVAVKVLSQRLASDPAFVKRFQAEAAAAARLTHPNVVPIYFIGEDAGRHFYAMRFINGESLADRLHRQPSLSPSEVLVIIQQVLQGLAAAHRMGLVHRDIKPGNILIDRENGLAMLTDFGLARSTSKPSEVADQNVVMGTAEYMSPEQARGEPADPRSDLYSVGVLLYQLLAGNTPFDADTPSSHLIHHVCTEPRPLSELVPDIDPQLEAIVVRLLRKRPDERYSSVEELLIDLDAATESVFAWPAEATRGMTNPRKPRSSRIGRKFPGRDGAGDAHPEATTLSLDAANDRRGDAPAVTEPLHTVPASRVQRRTFAVGIVGLVLMLLTIVMTRFHPQAGAVTLQAHQDAVSALAFSPDGRWLISGGGASSSLKAAGDTSLRLWNAATGQMVKQSDRLPVRPRHVVFLEDSRRVVVLASAREETGTVVVWDSHSGQLGPTDFSEPFALQFDAVRNSSADLGDSVLAVGRHGLTTVTMSGIVSKSTRTVGHFADAAVRAVVLWQAASGPQAIVAVDDERAESSVLVNVDLKTGQELSRLVCRCGLITALAISRDGRTLVTRGTEKLLSANGESAQPKPSDATRTAFDFVRVWDVSSQTERFHFGPFTPGSRALAVTPDARRALTIAEPSIGPRSHVPQDAVWLDLTTGQEICRFRTGSSTLATVALSPTTSRAALADAEGRVVFCDLP